MYGKPSAESVPPCCVSTEMVTTHGLSPLLSTPSSGTVVISTLKIQLTVIYCPLVVVDIGGHYHMLEIALSKPVSNYEAFIAYFESPLTR
jgi:hypothetical protein